MDSLQHHPNQFALDEFADVAVVDLAQHRQGLVQVRVQLGPDVLALEGHELDPLRLRAGRFDFHKSLMHCDQGTAEGETWGLTGAAMKVADRGLSNPALSRDLGLGGACGGEFGNQRLPVHAALSVSGSRYSATGLPIVNIGKLMTVRKEPRTPFGQRMFDARKAAKKTQMAVTKALRISQGTLSGLENEAASSGRVVEFATLYGVDPVWLATGEGGMKPQRALPAQPPDELSASEWGHLQDYRDMAADDKRAIDDDTRTRAEKMRAMRREIMAGLGLPPEAPVASGNNLPMAPRTQPSDDRPVTVKGKR